MHDNGVHSNRRWRQAVPLAVSFLFLLLLGIVLVTGRSTPQQILRRARAAERRAQLAEERNDPVAAHGAADEAREAADLLEHRLNAAGGRPELRQLFAEAHAASHSALEYALLADEKEQKRKKLNSWKVRAYGRVRTVVLGTVLSPLAAAAEKAAAKGVDRLSLVERPLAQQARRLAGLTDRHFVLPNGEPDWRQIGAELRTWGTNATVELRAFLGLTLVLAGSRDFALSEFEAINPGELTRTNALQIYHAGRALLYAAEGWDRMATPEVEAFCKLTDNAGGMIEGKPFLAMFHGYLACHAFEQRDYEKMDAEIARSIQSWPNNPVAVFLTGERLAADGQWEKAATSLETLAAGTQSEWVAHCFSRRARELRDGRGSGRVLLPDSGFIAEVAAHYAIQSARDSAAGRKFSAAVEEAKQLGQELYEKLPFVGSSTNQPTRVPQ